MRHRQAAVLAAVAVVGLSGCAADPGNLKPDYDDMTPTSAPPTTVTSVPITPLKATPTTPAPDPGALLDKVLLSDEDVAGEGVHPGSGEAAGCLTDAVSETSRTATWQYPAGSVLRHRVAAYPGKSGADVVAAAECAGKVLSTPAQPGVDVQRGWCQGSTCTVLLAKGNLVSALTVSASTETRAADAAKRLLPAMAAKLTAQP